MRRLTTTCVLVVLAGCVTPGQVIEQLPEPPLSTLAPRPKPTPPPPAPRPKPQPTPRPTVRSIRGATIIVDAGHGGRDPGARGRSRLPEKTINLRIAMRLVSLLQQMGARVITTRSSDRFVDLDDRAAMAERTHADLFVSIHADSISDSSISGATVYIGRNASSHSVRAARRIQSALESSGIPCRGVRPRGFRVLVGHSRPAVLVECGYLTNSYEARRLNSADYQARLAGAIAAGIASHFGG